MESLPSLPIFHPKKNQKDHRGDPAVRSFRWPPYVVGWRMTWAFPWRRWEEKGATFYINQLYPYIIYPYPYIHNSTISIYPF